jgi:CCR4-NOT complex subunit CAF16
MGLMGEWDVLLLDEVTVDLDVLVRSDLIDFLVSETETRGATILCKAVISWLNLDATHIFDGLSSFPTHICHLQLGRTPKGLITWQSSDAPSKEHSLYCPSVAQGRS